MMTPEAKMSGPFVFLVLILITGLTLTVLIDPYIQRRQRKNILLAILLIFTLVIRDYTAYLMDITHVMPFLRTLVAVYGYALRPVILVLLGSIVSRQRMNRAAWVLLGINAAIYLTALFSGICFSIDQYNQFHRGPLGYTCHLVSGILLFDLAYLTIRKYGNMKDKRSWIPLLNILAVLFSVVLDSRVDYRNYPVTFLTVTVVSCMIFYYFWLHLQFARENEQNLEAEQRIRIMMTQIQPHFLYNTLTTIQALCRIDPDKAFHITEKFGQYLRQNLDTLDQPGLIPVRKELEHTKIYAEIEMLRFSNIQVSCEIEDEEFSIPALTIQPLVENSIRHGVRIREKGLVTVTTARTSEAHEIRIVDNGKGFDVNQVVSLDQTHIGLRNVRERIEKMCGGTLSIDSRIGEGTVVTIQIPLQPGRKED